MKKSIEVDPEKKKLIRIIGFESDIKDKYTYKDVRFAFVAKKTNDKTGKIERVQVSSRFTCREYLNAAVRNSLCDAKKNGTEPTIDFDQMRLLIVCDPKNIDTFKTKLFNGKKCLNLLEDINGWERSTVTTVKHEWHENAWLVTGPKEWMSQPQLLSLATWVLRSATKVDNLNTNNLKDYIESLKTCSKKMLDKGDYSAGSDLNYFLEVFADNIELFIKNVDRIFEDIFLEDAWTINLENDRDSYDFGSDSGLCSFIENDEIYYSKKISESLKRFKKFKKEFLSSANKTIK